MAKKTTQRSTKKSTPQKAKPTSKADLPFVIHLISGSTGDLLYRMASVAVTQFSSVKFKIHPHPLADSLEKIEQILDSIDDPKPVVIHGLADSSAKQFVRSHCVRQRLWHFDATGPLFDFLSDCVGHLPDNDLSTLHRVDAAYQRRIEAMEFAVEHDDGLGTNTLQEADIVIVGPSRVSKSPTTMYLASRGYKVANVSIAPETGFPADLKRARKKRIVALTMQPKRLQEIRRERMEVSGAPGTSYDSLKDIIHEMLTYEQECQKRGYPMIDVTSLTIEQTAVKILGQLKLV